jgi:HK97 family phage prohead protease
MEWREVGRRVPLHWNHVADQIIGDVDPAEMWETEDGLEVAGRIDLDTELGQSVWRSIKANRIGFSFGYVATKTRARRGGGRDLLELDIFEVSATPSPANNQTRVLETKSQVEVGLPTDWKDEKRYSHRGKLISYRQMMLDIEVRKAIEEIEAEETKALKEAEAEASAARARELVPTTDKPFSDGEGGVLQLCNAKGCNAFPTTRSGSWAFTKARRWWCPEHQHLAGPDDHLPPVPTYVPGPNPGSVRVNPESAEGKRVRAEFERRREEQRQRQEADEREAEAIAEVQERYVETATVPVNGVRVKPANLRFRS